MLRRAEMRMTWIVRENGGVTPVPVPVSGVVPFLRVPERYEYGRVRSPFYEDEDEDEDGEDGDGRSLETVTDFWRGDDGGKRCCRGRRGCHLLLYHRTNNQMGKKVLTVSNALWAFPDHLLRVLDGRSKEMSQDSLKKKRIRVRRTAKFWMASNKMHEPILIIPQKHGILSATDSSWSHAS